ncbi:MAG: hypothetical protein QNJ98_01910 [Planctomycetota bacterium]|nr:hypothetical protein [Planctomycetota bacterium]
MRASIFSLAAACVAALVLGGCQSAQTLTSDDVAALDAPVRAFGSASDAQSTDDVRMLVKSAPVQSDAYVATNTTIAANNACCWSGCGLPCEQGISTWDVRAVVGYAFQEGDDPGSECGYFGIDVGRDFCSCPCWGIDGFLRYHECEFDRVVGGAVGGPAATVGEDGGQIWHLGVKVTWENSLRNSRWYYWVGFGPEYWWTQDYQDDDSGFGVYGEIGIGYVVNQNVRIRGGVNLHWLIDAEMGRENATDDGSGRDLFVIAPSVSVEFNF